ncbi:hypothetical protein SAMN05444411_101680 [Lutibacter oricola]|uniref:TonB protein C-terminal n=1 Tax=Lutibacter oricola TaxID=762486 RepID=A0A1H2TDM1_9FLAO|nr:hypothetical protein [Lutibacter oricola]SDW42001.1 hypothetical protein SAMN05444411_101680 [Lutibacter oricola]
MKNILTFLFICSITFSFGQVDKESALNNVDKWDTYTNPGTDNYFYNHFKKYLTSEIISKEKLSKSKKKIYVEFNLVDGIVGNIETNASNKFLKTKIKYAFNKLDFNKVSIKKNSAFHKFSLQLIENVNNSGVLKCSSVVLHETPPICINCDKHIDLKSYNQCIKKKLLQYLTANIDSAKFANLNLKKEEQYVPFAVLGNNKSGVNAYRGIEIKLNFDNNGKVSTSNNAENNALKNEINTILNGYNYGQILPATFNNKPVGYSYKLYTSEKRLLESWLYKTSPSNNLSKYFKERIPQSLIDKEEIDDFRSSVRISFSLDKKGRMESISSTAKNEELNEQLIKVFKKYPVEKLNIPTPIHKLSTYSFTVIVANDFKNSIECSNYISNMLVPIAKGCEKSKSFTSLKKCLQDAITSHVNRNFNSNLARELKLSPGVKRIYVMFKINHKAEIVDVKARAPHKKLTAEAIRVVKTIEIVAPAYHMGNVVGIKYSLPIAFRVAQGAKKDPFKGMNDDINKRRY